MTSIPKPLKFLRSHYQTIKDIHEAAPAGENKTLLADVISVRDGRPIRSTKFFN